jgi:predicted DNA-binding WGR domain protein
MLKPFIIPTPRSVQLVKKNKTNQRFYTLQVQPDLFGKWSLLLEWGKIGNLGHTKIITYKSKKDASNALKEKMIKKLVNGYKL